MCIMIYKGFNGGLSFFHIECPAGWKLHNNSCFWFSETPVNASDIEVCGFITVVLSTLSHSLSYRLLDSLVVECWHRVRELPGSIPSQ